MTVKESQVICADARVEVKEKVHVAFSYGLENRRDFEILTKGNEYYIFAAFVIKNGQPLCVFGSTRRHRELEQAIIDDIGILDKSVYGQMWLNKGRKAISLWFNSSLGENDKENEERLLFCLGSVNHELLGKDMIIKNDNNKYSYDKENRRLIKDLTFRLRA